MVLLFFSLLKLAIQSKSIGLNILTLLRQEETTLSVIQFLKKLHIHFDISFLIEFFMEFIRSAYDYVKMENFINPINPHEQWK